MVKKCESRSGLRNSNPTVPVEELMSVLDEELTIGEQLLEVTQRERDVLVRVDVGSLQRLVPEKEVIVERLAEAEARRHSLMAGQFPYGRMHFNWNAFAESLPESVRPAVTERRQKLRELAERLSRANKLNASLIEQMLEHNQAFLRFLVGASTDNSTYSRKGIQAIKKQERNLFDHVA